MTEFIAAVTTSPRRMAMVTAHGKTPSRFSVVERDDGSYAIQGLPIEDGELVMSTNEAVALFHALDCLLRRIVFPPNDGQTVHIVDRNQPYALAMRQL